MAGTGIISIDLVGLVRHAKGLSVLKRAQNETSNSHYLLEFFPLTIIMATLEDVRGVLMNMWSLSDFLFVTPATEKLNSEVDLAEPHKRSKFGQQIHTTPP